MNKYKESKLLTTICFLLLRGFEFEFQLKRAPHWIVPALDGISPSLHWITPSLDGITMLIPSRELYIP